MKVVQYTALIEKGNPNHPQLQQLLKENWSNFREVLKFFKALMLVGEKAEVSPRFLTLTQQLSDMVINMPYGDLIGVASYYHQIIEDGDGRDKPFAYMFLSSDPNDGKRAAILFQKFAKAWVRAWLDLNEKVAVYCSGDHDTGKRLFHRFICLVKMFEELQFFPLSFTWRNLIHYAENSNEGIAVLCRLIQHQLFMGDKINLIPEIIFQDCGNRRARGDWNFFFGLRSLIDEHHPLKGKVQWSIPEGKSNFLKEQIAIQEHLFEESTSERNQLLARFASRDCQTYIASIESMWEDIETRAVRTINPQSWVKLRLKTLNDRYHQFERMQFARNEMGEVEAKLTLKLFGMDGIYSIPLIRGKYMPLKKDDSQTWHPAFIQYLCLTCYHTMRVGLHETRFNRKSLESSCGTTLDGLHIDGILRRLPEGQKASAKALELMRQDPEFRNQRTIPEGWTYQSAYTFGEKTRQTAAEEELRKTPKFTITDDCLKL